jgi:hypothetical protein
VKDLKFRILPKVHGFRDAQGVHHLPGEVVDLPASYKGETWLQPVKAEPKAVVPPAKVEAPVVVPLEAEKPRKAKSKRKKKKVK